MAEPVIKDRLADHAALSVSELTRQIKESVERSFGRVRVRGEIGRVSHPSSGHIYLDLKDESAVLAAVIWKGQAAKLANKPEQGLEVICTGRLTTYGNQSRYQLIIESLTPAGKGALMALIDARRKKFAALGLFDRTRKKELPFLPKRIGVITSPSGAVIRDILQRLEARFARPVLLWPVQVQGERCGQEVAAAIDGLNALPMELKPDLIIVARGGGSLEDLQGFNEEAPVLAASRSEIALISAIGHETDHTLLDLVADQRAPTPTAAAEIAVPIRLDLQAQLHGLGQRNIRASQKILSVRAERLEEIALRLRRVMEFVNIYQQRIDDLTRLIPSALQTHVKMAQEKIANIKMTAAIETLLHDKKTALENIQRLLEALSYQNILERGFALVRDELDRPIQKAADTKIGQRLRIEFAHNERIAVQRIQKAFQPSLLDD